MSPTASSLATASPEEIARFTAMAESWWNPEGKFKPLHRFNPMRLAYLRRIIAAHYGRDASPIAPFNGLSLLDVGCGGGLLSEPLARMGFAVTGIDAGDKNIRVAQTHAQQSGINVDYRIGTPESLDGTLYDVVISMEVIEHVTDPQEFITQAAARLKPGGIFVGATMNRTPKAYALAIIGAEYVLRWLPRGTHTFSKFIRPSEFTHLLHNAGITATELVGASYDIVSGQWHETPSLDVNYMIVGVKP